MQQTNGSYTNGAAANGGTSAAVPTGFNQPGYNTGNGNKKVALVPNTPERIALKFATGKLVDSHYTEEKQVLFSLVDGRSLFLGMGIADRIYALQLKQREEFYICKKVSGAGQSGYIDVWLTPEGEKARAAEEIQEAERSRQEQARLHLQPPAPQRMPPASVPAPQQVLSTGTTGPAPAPASQVAPQHVPNPNPAQPPCDGLVGWAQNLLAQTNQLIDVYAIACQHAEKQGVPNAVVRTVMLSAFIGLQRKGNY